MSFTIKDAYKKKIIFFSCTNIRQCYSSFASNLCSSISTTFLADFVPHKTEQFMTMRIKFLMEREIPLASQLILLAMKHTAPVSTMHQVDVSNPTGIYSRN